MVLEVDPNKVGLKKYLHALDGVIGDTAEMVEGSLRNMKIP